MLSRLRAQISSGIWRSVWFVFLRVCLRAYFYSLSSDRSSEPPRPSTWKPERGEEEREEDGMGKKGERCDGGKRKRMERKERKERRRADADREREREGDGRTERQHMERQQNGKKELTNEWNRTKGGEVLD
ncbi:Hypothetical predicted protein [Xyrichtys novacula]|uniref:Uncharacterized protein n=1 Tax=Xyrichtys novacula TaxID=13765 RepID=A0AAV1HN73_XYRNO|nr:Hypothetical predicted protein [Xyrichtys novacula]